VKGQCPPETDKGHLLAAVELHRRGSHGCKRFCFSPLQVNRECWVDGDWSLEDCGGADEFIRSGAKQRWVSSLEGSPLEWTYDVHGKLYKKQRKKVKKTISAVAPHFPTVMALRRADPGTG